MNVTISKLLGISEGSGTSLTVVSDMEFEIVKVKFLSILNIYINK